MNESTQSAVTIQTNSSWSFRVGRAAVESNKVIELDRVIESSGGELRRLLDVNGPFRAEGQCIVEGHGGILLETANGPLFFGPGKYALAFPPFHVFRATLLNACFRAELRITLDSTPCEFFFSKKDASGNGFEAKKSKGLARRLKRLLDERWNEPVRLQDIAREMRVSQESLSRAFQRDLGVSPVAYRSQMRLATAGLHILMGTPIADAALDVGFNDLSHFYSAFKNLTTVSPGRYQPLRA